MKGKLGKTGIICLALVIALGTLGVGYALWSETLTINAVVKTGLWDRGGTPGFWMNWDSHKTYTQYQIETWLADIRTGPSPSRWLAPVNIVTAYQMAAFLHPAGDNVTEKFLRHYLVTRLNVAAGRLHLHAYHNFSACDPGDYLGLGGGGYLAEVVEKIESKYGTSPTDGQFEIMKNVCEFLNRDRITPLP